MSKRDNYKHRDHNVICDRTGFKVKASQTRKEWNGLLVRVEDWEERHPQDFVRSIREKQFVDDPRPEPVEDTFVGPNDVTAEDL